MATNFNDLYKPFKDYFSKNYPTAPLRLEAKVKDAEGFSLNPSVEQSLDNKVTATVEAEQPFKVKDFCRAVLKVNINSNERVRFEIKAIHGNGIELTAEFDAGIKDNSKDKASITAERKTANTVLTAVARVPLADALSFDLSGTHKVCSNWTLGAFTSYNKGQFGQVTGAALYKLGGTSSVAVFEQQLGKSQKSFVKFGSMYTAPSQTTLGTEVVVSNGGQVEIQAGVQKTVQGTTLRSKVNNKGIVSVSAQRRFGDNLTGTLNAEWDAAKGHTGRVGLKLMWE